MPVKKTYSKSKDICKVTFQCPATDAKSACVVGDFNEWQADSTPMKKGKTGFSATVELESGKEYQFRYLLDGERWENDEADGFAPTPFYDAQNCVLKTASSS